jgi:signal peptidase II
MSDNGHVTPADPDVSETAGGSDLRRHRRHRRHRRISVLVAVAALGFGLDLLSKALIVANVQYSDSVRLLWGAVYLVQARNPGAAFSVGTGATILLTVLAVAVVGVIVRQARRLYSVGWAISLGLILAGALGNLTDRLFRSPGFGRGYVVDWISVFSSDGHVYPIFNAADSCIVCGAILAGVLSIIGISIDGRRAPRKESGQAPSGKTDTGKTDTGTTATDTADTDRADQL